MVFTSPAEGRWCPRRRDHSQAHSRTHDGAHRRGAASTTAFPHGPVATPTVAGEGQWSPAGRPSDGLPAIYETMLRPDAVHTSYVVGVAWMDTELLKATLYSGSAIPGGGPYSHTAPDFPTRCQNSLPRSTPGS